MLIFLFRYPTVVLIFICRFTYSQSILSLPPPAAVGAVSNGLWSAADNPAGLADVSQLIAGVSYNSPYSLSALAAKEAAIAIPAGALGTIGSVYKRFGYQLYNESHTGLLLSRKFADAVRAGVRFDYLSVAFGGIYGKSGTVTASAGLIFQVTPAFRIGMYVFNPQRKRLSKEIDYRYPSQVHGGLSYAFAKHAQLSAGVSLKGSLPAVIKCTFTYNPLRNFKLHAGYSTGLSPFCFGYIFRFRKAEIGMASGYHLHMGFSPLFSITFNK